MAKPIDDAKCVIDNLKIINNIIFELEKELKSGGMYVTRQKGGSEMKKNLIKILNLFKIKKKVACNYEIETGEQREIAKEEKEFSDKYLSELITVLATIVPETVKQLRELNKTVNSNLYQETKRKSYKI